MAWVRLALGVVFYLALYFGLVRNKHRQVLHPRVWIGEARSFKPSWGFLKKFTMLLGVLAFFYLSLPIINGFAESLMGGPSVTPGSANPSAVLASVSPWFLLVVGTTLPIVEEWLFRLVVIDSTMKRLGITGSLVFSAVLFSLAHQFNAGSNLPMFVLPFFSGIVLGAVYLKGGLRASIFLHSGQNFVRTIAWMLP